MLPLENSYHVIHGKETYTLEPDELCFINSNVMHQLAAPKSKGSRIFIQFDLTLLYNLSEFDTMFRLLPPILVVNQKTHSDIYPEILHYVKEIIKEYGNKSILCDASIYSFFIQIYLTLFKNELCKKHMDCNYVSEHNKRNEHVHRITSYNVCYTKLLRALCP